MAVTTMAVVGAVGSAYGAKKQGDAAKDAAGAQRDASAAGMAYQRERDGIFDKNNAAYLGAGEQALGQLSALNSGDYSGFQNSPDYLYARQQTQQGVERGAAARGGLYSGGTNVDLANALNGVASQNLGAYRNSLQQMAGMGQNAVMGSGDMGQQSANAMGGYLGAQGNAAANGAINGANAFSNGMSGVMGAFGNYAGSRQSSYQAPPTSYGAFSPTTPVAQPYRGLGPSNGTTNGWNFG